MAEKINMEISQSTADLINMHKEEKETTDAFLHRLLSMLDTDHTLEINSIIGPPGVGKSTIRRVFFEEEKPQSLLDNSLEPTRGIENYTYNWIDVVAGVADSAGQEIERWLNLDSEQAFGESDSVIFVFDVAKFPDYKEQILEDLAEALRLKKKYAPKAQFNLFLHKIDLIDEKERDQKLADYKKEINDYLAEHDLKAEMILLKIYYTSIKNELILSLVKSMRAVLYSYSKIMRRALIPYSMRL